MQALEAIRCGDKLHDADARSLGEQCPAEFFRIVVESLSDSFEPSLTDAYNELMRTWIPLARQQVQPSVPSRVDAVYVLSRVTLGSDIKITSVILDAMKHRFPEARILFTGGRKSAELFSNDPRIEHMEVNYPRSGPVSTRLQFAYNLRRNIESEQSIVIDPDSRLTQLGLIPACEPERYFHFPSRTAGGVSADNLSDLTVRWLETTFGVSGRAWIAPQPVQISGPRPIAAVSLGVGDNEYKRVGGDFEARLLGAVGTRCQTIWLDRGAGGEEAIRVTAAAEASGVADRVRFWEGSFAGFASLIAQSDLYVGYDSAGQHAAAAAGTTLITIFAGAPSARFRDRWRPQGPGVQFVIDADGLTPGEVCARLPLASLNL